MRRFAGRLFTPFAIVSLLLCVAACTLWVRSYFPEHVYAAAVDGRFVLLFADDETRAFWLNNGETPTEHRRVSAAVLWRKVKRGQSIRPEGLFQTPNPPPGVRQFLGIHRVAEVAGGVPAGYTLIAIPLAYPTLVLAIVPALWLLRGIRARGRRRRGGCVRCGYDLRASPERCPECGAFPALDSRVERPVTREV